MPARDLRDHKVALLRATAITNRDNAQKTHGAAIPHANPEHHRREPAVRFVAVDRSRSDPPVK